MAFVTTSNKGAKCLIFENFKYRLAHTSKNGEIRWRCTNSKCAATVFTNTSENIVFKKCNEHNHDVISEKVLNRQQVTQSVKRKAVDNILEKPSKLIRLGTNDLKSKSTFTEHDAFCVRKNIYYTRRKKWPALPKSPEQVHLVLQQISLMTDENENFLLINDDQSNIIVFCTNSNLKHLCKCDSIYMDGTFDKCTKFFLQMFTIHGFQNGHYIPLVFCLLPSKLTNTYERLFRLLNEKCQEVFLELKPKHVTIDFEKAIHKAVLNVWPSTEIRGCRFHLFQAWWRKIQNLGLSTQYSQKSSNLHKWLRYPFGLAYLDPGEVGDSFMQDIFEEMPKNQKLLEYYDYLVDNYIDDTAIFPTSVWARQSSESIFSTNSCESFHSEFNSHFYSPHPNLFSFIETLLHFQHKTYRKIRSVHEICKKKKIVLNKENSIHVLIEKYKSNSITRFDFVKCISHYNMKIV